MSGSHLDEAGARRALVDLLGFEPSAPQWDALAAPLDPGVIVAGAGSGKTAVMSARMLWMVLTGQVEAPRLLGLTFTTKAAGELMGRTRSLLARARRERYVLPGDDEAVPGEPQVSTYHAFAAGLISDHGLRLGLEPGVRVLADGARHQWASRVIATTDRDMSGFRESPHTVVTRLLALDDALSELGLTPQQVRDHGAGLVDDLARLDEGGALIAVGREIVDKARLRETLTFLVEDFRDLKRARGVVDFADQMRWALTLARSFPEVREQVRDAHRLVLLDEYQDTSVAQRLLLQALFGEGHPVTGVGDPCQAIYEWRGASVVNIERFAEHFPRLLPDGRPVPADRYPLVDNRRSGPPILELANHLSAPLRANSPGVDPLRPGDDRRREGRVRVAFCSTVVDEVEWIAGEIAAAADGDGHSREAAPWGDVLVLSRTAEHLRRIDRALRDRGVPTQLIGVASLLDQPVVREIRAYLEVIEDSAANPAMVRILSGPRWRIGPRDLAVIAQVARRLVDPAPADSGDRGGDPPLAQRLVAGLNGSDAADRPSLLEAVTAIADGGHDSADLSGEAVSRLTEVARMMRVLRSHRADMPVEVISRVLTVTGLGAQLLVGDAGAVAERSRALAEFTDLAATFDDVDAQRGLTAFLARLAQAEAFDADPRFEPVVNPNSVRLMTVHKAKGLQAPHVFVTGLAQGVFPTERTRSRWPGSPQVVPWALRDDVPAHLAAYPDRATGPRTKDAKQFAVDCRAVELEEERRLCYVAVTRAETTVTMSGFGWGTATEYRGPSEYLLEARQWCEDHGGEVVCWAPPPAAGAENPLWDNDAQGHVWPRPVSAESPHRRAAREVLEAMARLRPDTHARDRIAPGAQSRAVSGGIESAMADLRRSDPQLWALVCEERQRRRKVEPDLPARTSVTELVRWRSDPAGMAQQLARPMPEPSSAAAHRGQALHAWIEQHYRMRRLLDIDDIPGAVDAGVDEWLERSRRAFGQTRWAQLTPIAIEEPFCLFLDGREVRGRIDAVFRLDGRDVVIDWKTGVPGSADPAQLDLYRQAWSAITGQPVEDIDAHFVYL